MHHILLLLNAVYNLFTKRTNNSTGNTFVSVFSTCGEKRESGHFGGFLKIHSA